MMIELRRMAGFAALPAAALLLLPASAVAHPAAGGVHGFVHGFAHPLLGADHLLAMLAVGLWSAQLGGRARWLLPAAFVTVVVAGVGAALAGVPLPAVEAGVLGSVLALGALVALAARAPLGAAAAAVALFALFHGHAHGAELPVGAAAAPYVAGLMLATALLHALGVASASLAQRGVPAVESALLRTAGVAIVLGGAAIWLL